jgi:hypothetical protein
MQNIDATASKLSNHANQIIAYNILFYIYNINKFYIKSLTNL